MKQIFNKLKQNWIKAGLGILILGALFFVKGWNNSLPNTALISDTDSLSPVPSDSKIPSAQDLIDEKCGAEGSNAGFTQCAEELLSTLEAERKWKQSKIEKAKHPQINTYDMVSKLDVEQLKIRNWRINFEKYRDEWCEATNTFAHGSSDDRNIAECKIEIELLAIKELNNLYYERILGLVFGSQGISDFEPTPSPIPLLTTSPNEAGHKSVSFYDEEPRDLYIGDYTIRVEKGWTTNIPKHEEIWKYLKVFKNDKVIYEVDAQWVEPWGYKLIGYDEYKIGDNTYYLFHDWNGAALQCCQQAISLVFNKDKFMYGKIWEAVNDNEYNDYKNKIIKILTQEK